MKRSSGARTVLHAGAHGARDHLDAEEIRLLAERVTIAVPTKNERANIGPFLASIPEGIPLIVVDASQDDTPQLVERLRPQSTILVRSGAGVTAARQRAADMAGTPWILFTDADVTFAPRYFRELLRRDLHAGLGAVYGTKTSRRAHRVYHRVFRIGQWLSDAAGIPAGSGSNMLVSRAALERVGGFDLRLACNEDSELLWRVQAAGYAVSFVPALEVVARDHRRLAQGATRKMLHSVSRCTLLYTRLLPASLRASDWGYWSKPAGGREEARGGG